MSTANILDIVVHPNDILRQVCAKIEPNEIDGETIQQLSRDMAKTMVIKDGLGLAAPQVGQTVRLIVVSTAEGPMPMINPIVSQTSLTKEWGEEGCLSLPHIFGQVKRPKTIKCEFLSINGERKRIAADGLLARVIQHEVDHLNGILFIDKAKNVREIAEE